jgi:hypothetical protein
MWIGKEVTGSSHDQFEGICGLEQMIDDDVSHNLRCIMDWSKCEIMLL